MFIRSQTLLTPLIVLLLTAVCLAGPPKKADAGKDAPKSKAPAPAVSSEEAIEAALESKTTCEFVDTPLSDVVAFFRDRSNINIFIDKRALDDVGLEPSTPINGTYNGIKLASALNLILRQIDLTWTIQDEVLLITTPEEAESMLITKVYAVTDLVSGGEPDPFDGGAGMYDYDSLIELITATIEPVSWDDVGGPGSIAVAPLGRTGALVISQTFQTHRKVENLLEQLRKVAREKTAKKKAE